MPRKRRETHKIYKVFIASPGDVQAERSIAFAVIDELNQIYASMSKGDRLEVRAWEKHSHPDLGSPQEVIKRQIPIGECDIFIGIFWKRFGTPPGSVRPSDGRPYLSGTEEEIETAIAARKESINQRPVIMLYRKLDGPQGQMTDEDHLQYAKVIEFFRQCAPDGEHPALVKGFTENQFKDILREHLLQVMADFESQQQIAPSPPIKSTNGNSRQTGPIGKDVSAISAPPPTRGNIPDLRKRLGKLDSVDIEALCIDYFPEVQDKFARGQRRDEMINTLLDYCRHNPEEARRLYMLLPPLMDEDGGNNGDVWLQRVGLERNPFQYWVTEDNLDFITTYQVRPKVLRVSDEQIRKDMNSRWIFVGNRGSGKTALCQMIAKSHYPQKKDDDGLCVICDRRQLEKAVELAGKLEALTAFHYVTTLYELIFTTIGNGLLHSQVSGESNVEAPRQLEDLIKIVRQYGLRYLICLVDQIDEVIWVDAQPEKMLQLLDPLMRFSWQTIPGITFRYFLPGNLERLLRKQNESFHLDRYTIVPLKWELEDLQQLVTRRLEDSSRGLITSLGQLCGPVGNFRAVIDQELVQLAEGSPRAVIWLANRLFELHCQTENPPRFIQPATWERVKRDWWTDGQNQLFGSPTQDEGFAVVGERIYFQGNEIILPKTSAALLCSLILASERGCSKAELRHAGWPDERPEGVTEAALTEAIRRMKAELKKQGSDPRWIKTVRGQGYRLQKPEEA